MKKSGRYRTAHLIEDQFEPGSRGRVLKNLLHIKTKRELDKAETTALAQATDLLVRTYGRKQEEPCPDLVSIIQSFPSDLIRKSEIVSELEAVSIEDELETLIINHFR